MSSFARTGAGLITTLLHLLAAVPAWSQEVGCLEPRCPGFELSAGLTGDVRRNLRGGVQTGSAVSGLLELGVQWHRQPRATGLPLTVSASVIHASGEGISGEYVGDLQGLNNIEADQGWYLYDLWTQIDLGSGGNSSLRMGLLDLNAEFDSSDTAGFFIGPPFGIGTDLAQTGDNGPAVFPVTALGLRFGQQLGNGLAWRLAAFESAPGKAGRQRFATFDFSNDSGLLLIGELELSSLRTHKVSFGAWAYTGKYARVDAALASPATVRANRGVYAMVDAPLGTPGGVRLDGMLRVGVTDGRVNPVDTYAGGAVVASGFLASRPDDAIGLAVAHGRAGAPFRRALAFDGGTPAASETQVELTYRTAVSSWLGLAPSIQWVATPGADRNLRDAWVLGLRFDLALSHSWPTFARADMDAGDEDRITVAENTSPRRP